MIEKINRLADRVEQKIGGHRVQIRGSQAQVNFARWVCLRAYPACGPNRSECYEVRGTVPTTAEGWQALEDSFTATVARLFG